MEKDGKERKRLESNMTYWLKASGELPAGEALRGQRRYDFLVAWVAKLAKEKESVSTARSSHDNVQTEGQVKEDDWWCKAQIVREFGEDTGMAMILSKRMPERPCRVTGLSTPDLVEYNICVKDATSSKNEDINKVGSDTNRELKTQEEAKSHLEMVGDISANCIPQLAHLKVEKEEGTPPVGETALAVPIKVEKVGPPPVDVGALWVWRDKKGAVKKLSGISFEIKLIMENGKDIANNVFTNMYGVLLFVSVNLHVKNVLIVRTTSTQAQ